MITWKHLTTEYSTINFSIKAQESNIDITLILSSDVALENVFLYTTSDWDGIISAKLHSGSTYIPVGIYSVTPSCYIGNLEEDEEVEIDFRLNFSTSYLGEQIVPLLVGYGSNIIPFYYSNNNIFWRDDSTDDPFFWYNTSEEVDADQWHDEN